MYMYIYIYMYIHTHVQITVIAIPNSVCMLIEVEVPDRLLQALLAELLRQRRRGHQQEPVGVPVL